MIPNLCKARIDNNIELSDYHMSSRNFYHFKTTNPNICFHIDEQWRQITQELVNNIQPWYYVSNYGRIYSKATDSIVKQAIINSGYKRIQLYDQNGHKIDLLVHRMVAGIWVYNDDIVKKTEVNHIDGNTFNNNASNLEWVTSLYNMNYHSNSNGNFYREDLTDYQIRMICDALQNHIPYIYICHNIRQCNYTGVMHKKIWRIHKRKTHINISKEYIF